MESVIYLDFHKAVDKVPHQRIILKLNHNVLHRARIVLDIRQWFRGSCNKQYIERWC